MQEDRIPLCLGTDYLQFDLSCETVPRPSKTQAEWRKQVVLSKYQACGNDDNFTTRNKAPIQCLNFGGKSLQTVVATMNQYVHLIHKCLGRYINTKIPSLSHFSPAKLAIDVEDFLHKSGLVVNECIPTTLQEIEKNKQLKGVPEHATAAGGEPLRPPQIKKRHVLDLHNTIFPPTNKRNFA